MIEITINSEIFKANTYDCSPTLVNIGDKVQTLDGVDHIENQMIKLSIKAGFTDISRAETARLLQALYSSKYPVVTFINPITNTAETRTFILQNNPSIPVKIWKTYMQYYESTSVELLEKGASFI